MGTHSLNRIVDLQQKILAFLNLVFLFNNQMSSLTDGLRRLDRCLGRLHGSLFQVARRRADILDGVADAPHIGAKFLLHLRKDPGQVPEFIATVKGQCRTAEVAITEFFTYGPHCIKGISDIACRQKAGTCLHQQCYQRNHHNHHSRRAVGIAAGLFIGLGLFVDLLLLVVKSIAQPTGCRRTFFFIVAQCFCVFALFGQFHRVVHNLFVIGPLRINIGSILNRHAFDSGFVFRYRFLDIFLSFLFLSQYLLETFRIVMQRY